MSFTYSDAVAAAKRAGFSAADSVIAGAVAMAESGGNETAIGGPNRDGSSDFGAWQINSVHGAILRSGSWSRLDDNARMAYAVWKTQGWKAWAAYNSGKHVKFLPSDNGADSGNRPSKADVQAAKPEASEASPLGEALASLASLPSSVERVGNTVVLWWAALSVVIVGLVLVFWKQAKPAAKAVAAVASKGAVS